jgi:hypothetical protein
MTLHSFQSSGCVNVMNMVMNKFQSSTVGVSFADFTEAEKFKEALDSKLEAKRQRRNGMKSIRARAFVDCLKSANED